MRICKSKKAAAGIFFVSLYFVLCTGVFAQSAQQMPEIEMPEMPSMPQIGGGYYKPSFPRRVSNNPKNKTTGENEKEKTEAVLTEALNPNTILSTVLAGNNALTANDISSLYDSGLFTSLSSLDNSANLSNYSTTTSTNILLQQVLNSLNDLKKQQQNASAKEKNALNATKTDSENFKQREPAVLRFKINGFNIADSLTDVFFSETEPDGTFLLTGDRKYFVNQQVRTETFYMLFKTVASNGSTVTYRVQPSIVQDHKNENSYVYRLASVKNLTAEKTGNLVVMHFADDSLNADLLLDIDSK